MKLIPFLLPKPLVQHSDYRPEIDGLRAAAIIPVVLYHAGVGIFPGGFIGVDVFFVISGYLITSIIHTRLVNKNFSIRDFYVARIRRIFPALFSVIVTAILFCSILLLPQDFKDFGQSLSATSLFFANIFFWFKTGYFDHAAETKPLLHTWSLGIEEQFYIFWPLFLWFVETRIRSFMPIIILTAFIFSFVASEIAVQWAPSSAFYLTPFRAWELMAGAVVALGILKRPRSYKVCEFLGLTGLAAIVAGIFFYDSTTPFPGIAAAPPAFGSMLIILSTEDRRTLTRRLLSSNFMVGVGAISYSLYLWHWPILSLFNYWQLHRANGWETVMLVSAIWIVSAFSFHIIEQPARRARAVNPQAVLSFGVIAVLIGVAFGGVTHVARGFPGRLPSDVVAISNAMEDINRLRLSCDRKSPTAIAADDLCRIGISGRTPDWILIGDSIGDAFVPGFDEAGHLAGRRGWALTWSGCLPLWRVEQIERSCSVFMNAVVDFLNRHPEVHDVVLVGRWTSGWAAERFGAFAQNGLFLTDSISHDSSVAENRAVMERAFEALFTTFPDRRFLVVIGIPEQKVIAPRDAAIRRLRGLPENLGVSRTEFESRQSGVRNLLVRLAHSRSGLEVIDFASQLCTNETCPLEKDGLFRYVDDNHPSTSAVRNLAPELAKFLQHHGPINQTP